MTTSINFMNWKDKGTIVVGNVMNKDDIVGNIALKSAEYLS